MDSFLGSDRTRSPSPRFFAWGHEDRLRISIKRSGDMDQPARKGGGRAVGGGAGKKSACHPPIGGGPGRGVHRRQVLPAMSKMRAATARRVPSRGFSGWTVTNFSVPGLRRSDSRTNGSRPASPNPPLLRTHGSATLMRGGMLDPRPDWIGWGLKPAFLKNVCRAVLPGNA